MLIKAQEITLKLTTGLPQLIWLSGNETLLLNEARDEILQFANQQGLYEKKLHSIDGTISAWENLLGVTGSGSLFSQQKILEVRLETLKLGRDAAKYIENWLQILSSNDFILISSAKITADIKKLKWVKLLDSVGWLCQIWPVEIAHMPNWIEMRARKLGLNFATGAASALTLKVEGNLLAAKQELDKLGLQSKSSQTITAEYIYQTISDNSHYSVYQLTDYMLKGEPNKTIKIFRSLLAEGVALPIITWALARDLRELAVMQYNGNQAHKLVEFVNQFIWQQREPFFRAALSRHRQLKFSQMVKILHQIDCATKGVGGNAIENIEWLLLKIARAS